MAVQAQYPSNVLLPNRNEGHDYSLQPQSGGLVLDQHHNPLLYTHGGINSHKKGIEVTVTTGITPNNNVMNTSMFHFESQPSQLIDLSQLHNQQQNVVSTGLCLSTFDDQQLQRSHHQNQNQSNGCRNSSSLSLLSQGLGSQIKQQRDEIDQIIQAQGEHLRRTLAEKKQIYYREMLNMAEEVVARRLREKEAEIEKATRRNAELEARAAHLAAEAQVWQAKARAQEAALASLQVQLQQTITASAGTSGCHGGDDVSCAVENQADDAESVYVDPDRVEVFHSVAVVAARPKCRGCGRRFASVVVLPCRHLCICIECNVHFRACPVCLTLKNSTVEVILS